MNKSGNEYLRYYLIEATDALRVHNAEYQAYYEIKFKEIAKHQYKRPLALTASPTESDPPLAEKLVRLVYALLKKGQFYRASYQEEA